MPTKDLHDEKPFDQATITKLEIFENYLTEWLPTFIFTKAIKKVYICDFFAGPGEDIIGIKGSPLRILDVIKKFEKEIKSNNRFEINIILNEKIKKKYDRLAGCVQEKLSSLNSIRDQIVVDIYNLDFEELFKKIKDDILQGPNLFFFDQNGVKYFNIDFINELETFRLTDYLFFLSSAYFIRFPFKNLFPDLNLDKDNIRTKDIHREIVETFRKKLPENSRTLLYHFSIKKEKNIYGLVFGSTHILAVEKFLTVAWDKNKINGEANFDIDSDMDTQLDLFTGQPKITKLAKFEKELEAFIIQKKIVTNKDIFLFTLEKGFIPKHVNAILKKLKESKHIDHFSYPKIGYNQIYNKMEEVVFRYIK